MGHTNWRLASWTRLAAVAAGLCLGGGCNINALNALVVGMEAAADALRDDDDDFFDWLDEQIDDDDVDDLGDLFD
jgi:hypothetical protein